jgi:hypothetical protein
MPAKEPEQKGFDWNEFLAPNWIKITLTIVQLFAVGLIIIVIFRGAIPGGGISCESIPRFGVLSTLTGFALGMALALLVLLIYLPAIFFYIISSLLGSLFWRYGGYFYIPAILLGLIFQVAYSYLLSCWIYSKCDFIKKHLKMIGILLAVVFLLVFIATPENRNCVDRLQRSMCLAQIAKASPCYTNSGEWNSTPANLLASDFDMPAEKCLGANGGLNGTAWKKDETHFNCGPKPA